MFCEIILIDDLTTCRQILFWLKSTDNSALYCKISPPPPPKHAARLPAHTIHPFLLH